MPDPQLPAGQVTIADLYRELSGMRADVGRALTRMEVLDNRTADADRLHSDHETRIRKLEAFRWQLVGIYVVLTLIGVYVGYLVGHAPH